MSKMIFAALCIALITSCTCAQTHPTVEDENSEALREFRQHRLDREH